MIKKKQKKQQLRELLAQNYDVYNRICENQAAVDSLTECSFGKLDRQVKLGGHLSFEEAFCGMCYAVSATNRHLFDALQEQFMLARNGTLLGPQYTRDSAIACGVAFLQLMAMKEMGQGLTAEEIAGLAAASMMDTVTRFDFPAVIETCGMGGDKGFVVAGSAVKTINISTLTSLVMSALGYPTIKHGSYGNTSAVGSTDAIEHMGAKINRTSSEVLSIWKEVQYAYLDAHCYKNIHDLSHLIMAETINHLTGPMSIPITPQTRLTKIMGVNEKVHPSEVARAYTILHERGLQSMGGVAILCGLSQYGVGIDPEDYASVREHTILDEPSPYATVVSLAYENEYLGTHLLTPEDFGVKIDSSRVWVPNEVESIKRANQMTLEGVCPFLVDFLSMNAGLCLFAEKRLGLRDALHHGGINLDYLREDVQICRDVLMSGKVHRLQQRYVAATNS